MRGVLDSDHLQKVLEVWRRVAFKGVQICGCLGLHILRGRTSRSKIGSIHSSYEIPLCIMVPTVSLPESAIVFILRLALIIFKSRGK
jgi:hypothetical protein